jgi:hypothetical protein
MLLGASMLLLDDPGKAIQKAIQIVRRSLPVPWKTDAGRRRKPREEVLEV